MIAADTSTWVAFIQNDGGEDVQLLDTALQDKRVLMPPAVLAEVLSEAKLTKSIAGSLLNIPLMEIPEGYWERVGRLRAKVLANGRRARLGDALIAQCRLDRGIPLLTRDKDFPAFADAANLDLVIQPQAN